MGFSCFFFNQSSKLHITTAHLTLYYNPFYNCMSNVSIFLFRLYNERKRLYLRSHYFFTISLKLAGNFSSLFSFVSQLFRFRHNPLWYQISKVFDKKTSSVGKPGEALCRRKNLTNQVAILIT